MIGKIAVQCITESRGYRKREKRYFGHTIRNAGNLKRTQSIIEKGHCQEAARDEEYQGLV